MVQYLNNSITNFFKNTFAKLKYLAKTIISLMRKKAISAFKLNILTLS